MRTFVVLIFVLAAACGGAAPESSTGATTGTSEAAAGTDGTVAVASTDLGDVLVDAGGKTLYLFTNDKQGDSTCYDDCESNWPPLEAPVEAGEGVDSSLLGEVERDDGTMQVTYNKWPVYYFAGDSKAGDTNGQGVGDVWFAIAPGGEAVASGDGDEGTRDY